MSNSSLAFDAARYRSFLSKKHVVNLTIPEAKAGAGLHPVGRRRSGFWADRLHRDTDFEVKEFERYHRFATLKNCERIGEQRYFCY
jgi:hypothetical protein